MNMDVMVYQLKGSYEILHLFYHRNRNQHRRGHWWKWLSVLKRCVKKLKVEGQVKDIRRVHARTMFIRDMLLPKCYISFTQLVQDNQFSALGLALVAELARINETILLYIDAEREREVHIAEAMITQRSCALAPPEDFGEAVRRPISSVSKAADSTLPAVNELWSASIQEGVEQQSIDCSSPGTESLDGVRRAQSPRVLTVQEALATEAQSASLRAFKKPRKNGKKQANPIDDLFDGLE